MATRYDAKKFVELYATGKYMPADHDEFLKWVMSAKADELEEIADHYEEHNKFQGGAWNPSADWVKKLEKKLDESDKAAAERHARLSYIIGWLRGMYLKLKIGIFKSKK
jgi:hypothetical protein